MDTNCFLKWEELYLTKTLEIGISYKIVMAKYN